MVKLYEKDREKLVAELSDEQFQFLVDHLEEESEEDTDYYLSTDTLDYLEEEGADPQMIQTLRKAMEGREDLEVRWVNELH